MCRLVAFHADQPRRASGLLITDPHSLLVQSRCDRRGECHGDGWGVGYFRHGEPVVIRSAQPAFDDETWRPEIEPIETRTLLGHVRQASVGSRVLANVHPFVHGRWIFAHNGTVTGFDRLSSGVEAEVAPDLLACRRGATDSELVFYWLLSRFRQAGLSADGSQAAPLPLLIEMLSEAIPELASRSAQADPIEPARLNFVLSDGRVLLASRWNHTLAWRSEDSPAGGRCVTVASEPTDELAWQELPDRVILGIDAQRRPTLACLES
jgi:glutamine amidotransferase